MAESREKAVYVLLAESDWDTVRERLRQHRYFYHFTLDSHIASIRERGLDPGYEGDDSRYANRNREPANAIRYCTRNFVELGLSAAYTRNQVWNDAAGMHLSGPAKIVLLRTSHSSLLQRSFGLDHSHGSVKVEAEAILRSQTHLSPDNFVDIMDRFGSISCYETIPPDELEICTDANLSCDSAFAPLKAPE